MPSKISLRVLITKAAHGKRLSKTEADFAVKSYESAKRAYLRSVAQCGEEEQAAILLSEAQCEVQALRMEADYWLTLRLDEDLTKTTYRFPSDYASMKGQDGLIYKVCLACYYETQMENMLATQEMPLTEEFLIALTALEAALLRVNDMAPERARSQRMWAN